MALATPSVSAIVIDPTTSRTVPTMQGKMPPAE
jgi:hypothetical protein